MAGKHKLDGKQAAPFQIVFLDVIIAFLKWYLMEREVHLPTDLIPALGAGETSVGLSEVVFHSAKGIIIKKI